MRLPTSLRLAIPLVAALAPAVHAQSANDPARIDRLLHALRSRVEVAGQPVKHYTLAERMAHYNVPGLSVAVIEGGKIAWAAGYGVKDKATKEPVTTATLFQAGSISKPVAATAMLKLVERGQLSLDTNVNRYLKSWHLPDNKFTAKNKVTLRRIASHSAGLTVHGFPGYEMGTPVPTVPQLLDGAKPANTAAVRVDTFPGAIWRYSGGGTTIEQLVLTDVSGKPFPQLLQELVLGPAKMTSSTYEQPLPAARRAEAASGHDTKGVMVKGRYHVYPEMAAAGLWTTPTDLSKWALAIADARAGKPGAILAKPIVDQMLTVQKEPVGLGPFLGGSGKTFNYGHGGSDEGMQSQLLYYPETGQGIALMTNGDGGSAVMDELMAAVREEYKWPEPPKYKKVTPVTLTPAQLDGAVGSYHYPVSPTLGFDVSIKRAGAGLQIEGNFIATQQVLATSPTTLVLSDDGNELTLVRDASGKVTALKAGGMEVKRVK